MRAGGCPVVIAQWQSNWLHKPGDLGSIPGDCWPFHFPLFSPLKHLNSLYLCIYLFLWCVQQGIVFQSPISIGPVGPVVL